MPFTADMLNVMLGVCIRIKAGDHKRIGQLGVHRGAERNSRTYELLMRNADGDWNRILRLLDELSAAVSTCAYGVVQAVLAASLLSW